jgi:hypothetical protein
MEVHVVFGWNRYAIPCCRMKTPIPQDSNDAIVHTISKSLKKAFFYHCSLRVNCNFHDYVALDAAGQL